ncbi:MAG: ATP-dependent helicase HrpB [Candidatus Tokpelaia hoelldobleri]|uniref:ATP-dependent helicase HrpB n=1 Tax=Candidatus Tokpelaia hoelldobleri TaxID=1902579 RepID=A0A1U9JV40_9HYPH|nr:MAG: ATP-dependent helicase HrpB [Candidatus Tokpelaia hoelldoblerii]
MKQALPILPVTEAFPAVDDALVNTGQEVLVAPPGAGKSTLLPLHLLRASWRGGGQILLLEPRRLAARAVARRMAALLGEKAGQTVGYRMRMEQAVSAQTRILVITEGVFTRMVLDDPALKGIAAVIFDEFHERSLDADFGLALALDIRGALRPDLRLLVMSATLDGARVAALMDDAPVVTGTGRGFPVDVRYQPRKADERIEDAVAAAVRQALAQEEGSILAFLPGQREIERVKALLGEHVPANVDITPLYGALDAAMQDAAIRPAVSGRRKVVLATSIAESSLTIAGVRIVIDSGLARVPVFEPATGLTRLETVRASRASVEQRAGRAGRDRAGLAIRLWHAGQTAAVPPHSVPEILAADLSSLVLDCAAFGVSEPAGLRFLDTPPEPALQEAHALLLRLEALDENGRLTQTGKAMRKLSLPVQLAHMVTNAVQRGAGLIAAQLALVLSERGLGGMDVDLDRRLAQFRGDKGERAARAQRLARQIAAAAGAGGANGKAVEPAGSLLLDAWPDRVAKARGETGRFVLANGRGGQVDTALSLSQAGWLVVAELAGKLNNARILSAAVVDEETIRERLAPEISIAADYFYEPQSRTLRCQRQERLGAIVLTVRQLPAPAGEAADEAWIAAVKNHGLDILPWTDEARNLRRRLYWLHKGLGEPWPDVSDTALLAALEVWLLPYLNGAARLGPSMLVNALMGLVPYALQRQVDVLAPTHFTVPTGSRIAIRYDGEAPVLSVRVQELFGLAKHPAIASDSVPLVVELLSPAGRPIQITGDLPGFWRGSWRDVLADMRGRYPKHIWPDDPLQAAPTRRAKPGKN